MRRIQSFIAMVLVLSSLLVFFYSTLRLETAHGHKAFTEQPASSTSTLHDGRTPPPPPRQPEAVDHNVSVSDGLRETVPRSGAYWNRLLYSALKARDGGGGPGRDVPWSGCRETNRELLQTNVHDLASYPVLLQTFVEGIGCRSPPVLIDQPGKCVVSAGDGERPYLLFAIKSSPGHFDRRQAVRETWGREGVYEGGLRVRTVFLLGSATPDDPDFTLLLRTEGRYFGDLVQWDFHESFLNLTLKMNAFLEWAVRRCPGAAFVFSGDDDVFVNTPALLGYLRSRSPAEASRLYVGHVIKSASPLRDPKSKYYIPASFYEGPYPAYAGGGGFLFSGAMLRRLHSLSHVIPAYPIDDVYVGMCFKALGAAAEAHGGFQTFDVKDKDRENLCVHKNLILVHQRSPKQLKRLWRGILSPLLTC